MFIKPSGKIHQHLAYDAWRTAMNRIVDWAWFQKDEGQQALSNRIQAFFYEQGINAYGGVYTLEGKVLNKASPAGLTATNATSSLAAAHPMAKGFVEVL